MSNILKQVEDIVKGHWAFYIKHTPEQQELSKQRLALCVQCKWYDSKNDKCKLCGCTMKVKTLLENVKCSDTGYERW